MGEDSPALVLHFSTRMTAAGRDRLVALLADHSLVAIQEDDLGAPRVWTAHFANDASRVAASAALADLPDAADIQIESHDVADEDWARRTQADLPAVRVGRIIVAPPWDVPPRAGLESLPDDSAAGIGRAGLQAAHPIVIVIEPSRGFGTGHHQSTRLALVLLQSRAIAGRTAIDVGTGSGVLSIAAAALGAAFVSAIDVDPDAVENARENIERNGVSRVVEAHVADLVEGGLQPADLVTANLTGALIARHADDLAALVKPAGALIVSGFTVDERDLVAEAVASRFTLTESAEEEGWWAFALTRITPPTRT